MSDTPFGAIEIVLGFGVVLAFAVWELMRNRRELARMKRDADGRNSTDA